MMRTVCIAVFLLMTFTGCKKKRTPKPPEAVQLIFPEQNSECTTGISLGEDTSEVEFSWAAADNTDTYELRVSNSNTGQAQSIVTSSTSAKLPLAKGEPFSWVVRSRNDQVEGTVSSELWNFYNAGSRTTFAPFPATIVSPSSSENVSRDINNEVTLVWSASDLDDDIVDYEVYLSEEPTAEQLVRTLGAATNSIQVTVSADTIYYWKVLVRDAEGNSATSSIYNFKVL